MTHPLVAVSLPKRCRIFKAFRRLPIRIAVVIALAAWRGLGQKPETPPSPKLGASVTANADMVACSVKELKKSDVQGLKVYSPDGRKYLLDKKDNNGISQVYMGDDVNPELNCITCTQQPGGPKPDRSKMQPHWHPSGRWIFLAVEREKYSPPPLLGLSRSYVEGQLENGLWTNMYAVSPNGNEWHQLTDFKSGVAGIADGFTGPAVTPDGKKVVWSQIIDGNVFKYSPFGRWQLILADFEDLNGVPGLTNKRDITPTEMYWNEPGNFAPDNESLLLSGSVEKNAEGMDQYILNIRNGELTNLTQSPKIWDEHGVFSPDGGEILFMSSYPYRNDPNSYKVLSLKAEFMVMNRDGSNLRQVTHFRELGYPEYSKDGGIAASAEWNPSGRSANLRRLFFPAYEYWDLVFEGSCGPNR
jgi:Tol biopolymer transport system component